MVHSRSTRFIPRLWTNDTAVISDGTRARGRRPPLLRGVRDLHHRLADVGPGEQAVQRVDGVLEADPAAGKALIAKLSKDKDEQVKKHAIEAGSPKKN